MCVCVDGGIKSETHSVHGEVDAEGVVQLIQKLHKAISLLDEKKKERTLCHIFFLCNEQRHEQFIACVCVCVCSNANKSVSLFEIVERDSNSGLGEMCGL